MGPACWKLLHLLALALLLLTSHTVVLAEDLHGEDDRNVTSQLLPSTSFVPLAGNLSTLAPALLQFNETQFYGENQEFGQEVSEITHMTSASYSEQVDLFLQDQTTVGVSSGVELASREFTTVPLVNISQPTSSEWTNTEFMVTHATLTDVQNTSSGTAQFNSVPQENGEFTEHTTDLGEYVPPPFFSTGSPFPSLWAATEQSVTFAQLPAVVPSLLPTTAPHTTVDNLDTWLESKETASGLSEVVPGYLLDVYAETDTWLVGQTSEEITSSPSEESIHDITSDAALASSGYTSEEDASFFRCEHFDFAVTPTVQEVKPTSHDHPSLLPSQPIFIILHSDWNTSVADWGIAWEALVYGSVGLFGLVVLFALLSLFCLLFRCPSGSLYFAVLHLLLISVGGSRAFCLFYDAYGHRDRLPIFTSVLMYDLAFPCMTSSFSIVFLLLSSRCHLHNSSVLSPRLCLAAAASFLHFTVSAGAVVIVDLLQQFPFLLFVSRGVYIVLALILSLSFFIFYCVARPQNSQLYDLKTSAPPTEYSGGCPFADSKDWNRAAHTVLFSASFSLFNCGLQLYAILHATGYGGSIVFGPWPWYAFQLGSSLCEVGTCLPLALVGTYPIFCSNEIGRTNCWTKLFCLSPSHVKIKAPMLSANQQWSSSQHEKLIVCDNIVRSDSEFFPLYTLVEKQVTHGEDLSFIYHSNKSLEVHGLSPYSVAKTPSFISVQIDSDSTVDFKPPSPINLRRSIDEALFSESLIPKSLFHGTALSSSLSLTVKSATPLEDFVFKEKAEDRGLYRTSSCVEIETVLPEADPTPNTSKQNTMCSLSPGTWREEQSTASSLYKVSLDGSSLVLCSSSENISSYSLDKKQELSCQSQGAYHTLTPPSQESLEVTTQPGSFLREDFIDVFGPIDALSVGSDTIDL
ncbi:proline-rich transmembrane protein 4 [Bombina bombina]|uniref:proline-rich transmembrane protein 4 n=1 Tax=Bombina bombina TaxID=8345 RepID=UPI00235AA87B|nr:proline-rich transmembrane protein 4 [Bombina bombina]